MSFTTSIPNHTVQFCLSLISYVRTPPSQAYTLNGIATCVINAVLTVSTTLVNALVIVAFWKSPLLRNKTPFFLIMVLSITDLAVGLLVHPLFILTTVKQLTGTGDCMSKTAYLTVASLVTGLSGMTLQVINIERYLAIVYPFVYQRHVTKMKLLAATLVLWALWVPVPIAPFFSTKLQGALVTMYVTMVCFTTIFVYTKIFKIARRKRRLAPKPSILSTTIQENPTLSSDMPTTPAEHQRSKLTEVMKDIKIAKMFILIVVSSQMCYLPDIAYHLYLHVKKEVVKTETSLMLGAWVITLITVNSSLNSLIFFWKNSQLRKEILRIVRCG